MGSVRQVLEKLPKSQKAKFEIAAMKNVKFVM
jgi:hypothetical protein